MEKITFTLVTAEKEMASQQAESVIVPGRAGLLGVLPHHVPMVVTLGAGLVTLENAKQKPVHYFISGGFVDITPDSCTVLAEHGYHMKDLVPSEIDSEIARLQTKIAEIKDPFKNLKSRQQLFINKAKLAALNGIPYTGVVPEA